MNETFLQIQFLNDLGDTINWYVKNSHDAKDNPGSVDINRLDVLLCFLNGIIREDVRHRMSYENLEELKNEIVRIVNNMIDRKFSNYL